ncbi:methyltransferase type 11 [Photobacterium jeanii]|uniref:Methyltransferase type 11 n=1 Tax=Photobacterium jeanii TaxID=858640 RepID=A0A178KL37_9GAMM|nr:class I SAM-dependent methyltransferase [Photobacterium jeanii]OAN17977.1 methyltransferase type 11 [Photobacterium jeanii]PST92354.1 class I SAM-dependent methyltransferase [Photobacterium jeanii]
MADENKWEQFASSFEEKNNYVVGIKDIQRVKVALLSVTNLGKMLELGCGNGTYTSCFVDSASHITATDLSEDMVAVTKERFDGIEHVTVESADCFALPYEDNSFDTVFMANLLHVIPEPERALAEANRVLKPEGKLMAMSFTLDGMSFFNKLGLKYRFVKTYGAKSGSSTMMTPQLASSLASTAKFENITTQVLGKSVKAVYLSATKRKVTENQTIEAAVAV